MPYDNASERSECAMSREFHLVGELGLEGSPGLLLVIMRNTARFVPGLITLAKRTASYDVFLTSVFARSLAAARSSVSR